MAAQVNSPPLTRVDTHVSHRGFRVPDPFAPRERPGASFLNAILATAFFRCWHLLVLFAAWATLISALNQNGHKLFMQSTLLTVVGTVLGFVISYRTTSSFERYNEGRRLWSQVVLACRTFARTVWFHVPDQAPTKSTTADEMKGRGLIEKKTIISLLEAFAVSLKHYLRGEDGIYYEDLYYLIKFLPAYALPPSIPNDKPNQDASVGAPTNLQSTGTSTSLLVQRSLSSVASLPPPVTSPMPRKTTFLTADDEKDHFVKENERVVLPRMDESLLLPASNPPKYALFDLFPFSLLVHYLVQHGQEVKGKKAAKLRARLRKNVVSHNIPLELSLYLSSYISALQNRKQTDVPTINTCLAALNQLVDALTGLERILTTPIPFSYSIHLWLVTIIYCFFLPFQIWSTLKWLTVPGTVIISFFFFGFIVAGEEIENPFGYDKNDLNLDHFTNNIIRNELRAITSAPPPDPARWAFSMENDLLFSNNHEQRVPPSEWMKRGHVMMQTALGTFE